MVASESRSRSWSGFLFMVAGLAMIVLWMIFTSVHGPTSFDREGELLGRSTFFWGSLLGGAPNLLLVFALFVARDGLGGTIGKGSKIGFTLLIIGLSAPAVIDLLAGSLGPPLFVPLVGVGLLLLAAANRDVGSRNASVVYILAALGLLQLSAAGLLLLPQELSDQILGFRIYGVLAYLLFGAGWMLLGHRLNDS